MAGIPIQYNIRSLRQRPVLTLATALGMGLVVAVFIAMMALAEGFRASLVSTGSSENALVLRKGADSEMSSGISRETAQAIAAESFVAAAPDGHPMVSPEVYVVLALERLNAGGMANVVARGVGAEAFQVRKGVRVTEGRMWATGAQEVLVGKKIAGRFAHCGIGEHIKFANREWTVVGHFEAAGSSFESEIWGENEQFMPAFRGEVFQSVTFRLRDASSFPAVQKALQDDPRFRVDCHRELDFYKKQSAMLGSVLQFLAIFITLVMAIGAVFGAVNTMYAMVASRGPEIAILLTLGFRPASVLGCFLVESLVIALLGGLLGCALALPINGIVTSTTNWSSFSEIAFAFRVTPALLAKGLIFSLLMGLAGGYFPARRAARANVIETIRQG